MLINRIEINYLLSWAMQTERKPLVIRGARQVGKSTAVRQLARSASLKLVELNFERNPELRGAFIAKDPAKILTSLELLTRQTIGTNETLLFLDEIQAAPEALAALRYFYEEKPRLHVIAAGSLLEFTLAEANFSMPVGRVEYMYLGPVQFEDFLEAVGEAALASWLRNTPLVELRDGALAAPVHDKYMALLRQYCIVGGLPEAIATFADKPDLLNIGRVHQSIVATYRDDFNKYSHGALRERVRLVFDRLPQMTGRKFKYVQVSQDHRSSELAAALQRLCMARVAYKVRHTAANGIPLEAEVNERYFKTLYMDVGLMCSALNLSMLDLEREDLALINQGALAEQFIGQHLLYSGAWYEPSALYYWMREAKNSNAEVDYIIAHGRHVIPIEIKSGKTGTLRSLHRFLKEKRQSFALRFNADQPSLLRDSISFTAHERLEYELLSLPVYMIGQMRRLLREHLQHVGPSNNT